MTGADLRRQAQAAQEAGAAQEAIRLLDCFLLEQPGDPWARVLRASALHALKDYGSTEAALAPLLADLELGLPALAPQLAAALRVLASLRIDQDRVAEAAAALQAAIALEPDHPELRQWLCGLLLELGRADDAVPHYEAMARLHGGDAGFWDGYAKVLDRTGNIGMAEKAYLRALAIEPRNPVRYLKLAQFLGESGRIPEAVPLIEKALVLQPDQPDAVSGLLASQLYDPRRSPEEIARDHRTRGEALQRATRPLPAPQRDWDPLRPLHVGYLSADFRDHSCAHFLEPLLRAHDRRGYHLTLYYSMGLGTSRTAVFHDLADRWVEVHRLDDAALAERIREDAIDVLVDVNGHTAFNRLPVLPFKAAPVQLEWLGYPFTTGLDCLDGRITDSSVDPVGNESFASEPLLRIDPCYLAWQPPRDGPAPAQARSRRPFTFASFNALSKVNPAVVEVWAALLRRVPGSRLLLKGKGCSDPVMRDWLLEAFRDQGVAGNRLELMGFLRDTGSHLRNYQDVDLALDPFPYNGVTTTLEALWMGVPVLALEGRHSMARHGGAFLGLLGLQELVGRTPADCIAKGVALARDPERLQSLRANLRNRLLASPLCDAESLARRMEGLFRQRWERACAKMSARGHA